MSKLFVGSLPWATTEQDLVDLFSEIGLVVQANIICDRNTGRSRGYGFVKFDNETSAQQAQQQLNGYELEGRTIKVDFATERAPRPEGGNYNNRRGGYNNQYPQRGGYNNQYSQRGGYNNQYSQRGGYYDQGGNPDDANTWRSNPQQPQGE
ncbi:hypothetical protein IWQ61_003916 [Dispira simplex]|nr:hypothetical protein IWQ61_003916 [Dispira simplex]